MSTWALHTTLDLDAVNLHLAALEDAGLLGIAETDGRATVYLSRRAGNLPVAGRWEPVPDRDWHAQWQARLRPITVGALVVAPPWLADEVPGALLIHPGQAFGTGHHDTTTGCLTALQNLDLRGRRVLDVGCGTGVLGLAALRLGAAVAVAVDVDPLAVAATRDNAARNHLPLEVHTGSLEAVAGERFDVVLANLDTATLVALARALAAALTPGGRLIASGVSVDRSDEASSALRAAGLTVEVTNAAIGSEWVIMQAW